MPGLQVLASKAALLIGIAVQWHSLSSPVSISMRNPLHYSNAAGNFPIFLCRVCLHCLFGFHNRCYSQMVKNPPAMRETWGRSLGKLPWRREQLPTPVFWLGEVHGQRSLAGYSPWGLKELDTTEWLSLFLCRVCLCCLFGFHSRCHSDWILPNHGAGGNFSFFSLPLSLPVKTLTL